MVAVGEGKELPHCVHTVGLSMLPFFFFYVKLCNTA